MIAIKGKGSQKIFCKGFRGLTKVFEVSMKPLKLLCRSARPWKRLPQFPDCRNLCNIVEAYKAFPLKAILSKNKYIHKNYSHRVTENC
jgi:hypothetical protein